METQTDLVGVVLDEERLLNRWLRARHVLADRRLRVGLRARLELVLRGLVLVLLAAPDLDARRLRRGDKAMGAEHGSSAAWRRVRLAPAGRASTRT